MEFQIILDYLTSKKEVDKDESLNIFEEKYLRFKSDIIP